MINAIRDIGKVEVDKIMGDDKFLQIFTEDFSKGTKYDKVLEIVLTLSKDKVSFKEINSREYDDELKFKYLYRTGSSRGADLTPTAKITEPRKTYTNKIIAALEQAVEYCEDKFDEEKELLKLILECLSKEEKNTIIKGVEDSFNSIPKNERYVVLTVVVDIDRVKKYVGDFEVFKERIRNIPISKFYYSATYNKEVKGEKCKCSICNEIKEEVYGLASPFAFYTIDKPGYISGDFNYEKAWRNYPVCKECAIELELGKNYMDQYLQLNFYGRKFYLIPKLIFPNKLNAILRKYRSSFGRDEFKKAKDIISPEERLFKKLSEEDNSITFDLMFIEENNSALNILINIEDVYPSTFSSLYNQWEEIKCMNFFENIGYLANFNYLNMLFNSKENNKYFLAVVDKIIGNGKLEYNFLVSFVNKHLIQAFKREEKDKKDEFIRGEDNYGTATLRSYTFIYYLYKLDKFKNKGREGVEDMVREKWDLEEFGSKKEVFEDFFNCNKAFFNTNSKKCVFMIGYLCKKLINIQAKNEGGRKPFMSNLNGLNITKRDLIRLLPKIQGKLQEYKMEYYNDELQIASEYLIESSSLDDLANLDIPLYFSMGINMQKRFKLNKSNNSEENLDEVVEND
ncbi:MAG: TIGR02556 family CRISPR-associated protein [Clostridium sp.]|uniref:TIGR02556 family CRISPR-associated protein n=1 Tax=Clostridium sp. TaxID=1506 RepID=UPI0030367930